MSACCEALISDCLSRPLVPGRHSTMQIARVSPVGCVPVRPVVASRDCAASHIVRVAPSDYCGVCVSSLTRPVGCRRIARVRTLSDRESTMACARVSRSIYDGSIFAKRARSIRHCAASRYGSFASGFRNSLCDFLVGLLHGLSCLVRVALR